MSDIGSGIEVLEIDPLGKMLSDPNNLGGGLLLMGIAAAMAQQADEEAKTQLDSGTAAATCATGDCGIPPKCKDITEEMLTGARTVKQRYDDMV